MIEIFQTILEFAQEADPVQPDLFIKGIWPFSIKNPKWKKVSERPNSILAHTMHMHNKQNRKLPYNFVGI